MTKQFIYQAVGTTRQAHAAYWARKSMYEALLDASEAQLIVLRRGHPGLGLQKAWSMMRPKGVSRARFCNEMTWRGYALEIKRSFIRVTRSGRYRFPNLIKGLIINAINQVWQSDTTYYRIAEVFYYITFIIDVYSRKIVGWSVSKNLLARANVMALEKAFEASGGAELSGLIFHSDGGTQYRSKAFVAELRQRGISSSMCDVAMDNAYAERLNGVIKQEYLNHWQPETFTQLRREVKRAVSNYNKQRWHGQLPLSVSPNEFIEQWHAGVEQSRYALRIKDGQGSNEQLDALVVQNLSAPGLYAYEGGSQILPANVIYLKQPKEKMLCEVA